MTTSPRVQQNCLSVTFLHCRQPLFQITLQTSNSHSLKSILCHIIKTISMDIHQNPQVFFLSHNQQTSNAFMDQSLTQRVDINSLVGQTGGKLFYNLVKEQMDMVLSEDFQSRNRVERPMKKAKNMERNVKRVREQQMGETVIQPDKQQFKVEVKDLENTLTNNQAQHSHKQPNEVHNLLQGQKESQTLISKRQTKPISEHKLAPYTKSLQEIEVQKKHPNQSTYTKTQSTYFEQQPNLNQSSNQHTLMPIRYHQLEKTVPNHQYQLEQGNKRILQGQLRSQSTQQVKEDSCCQII